MIARGATSRSRPRRRIDVVVVVTTPWCNCSTTEGAFSFAPAQTSTRDEAAAAFCRAIGRERGGGPKYWAVHLHHDHVLNVIVDGRSVR